MATINLLNSDLTVQVDPGDWAVLQSIPWGLLVAGKQQYARSTVKPQVFMHEVIMGFPKPLDVDHKDGNGLNNCRNNLRTCTRQQNNGNTRKRVNIAGRSSTSKYKGVSWLKRDSKWVASIGVNYKRKYLGSFANESEAALAYNRAAKKYFGDFARLNTIEGK